MCPMDLEVDMQASSQPTRSRSQPARSRRVSQPSADKKNAGLELQNKSLTQSVETLRGQLKDRNKDYRAAIRSKNGHKDQVLELRGAKPQEAAVSVIKTREHAGKRAPCTVEHIAHAAAVVHASGVAGIALSRDRASMVRDWFQTRPS